MSPGERTEGWERPVNPPSLGRHSQKHRWVRPVCVVILSWFNERIFCILCLQHWVSCLWALILMLRLTAISVMPCVLQVQLQGVLHDEEAGAAYALRSRDDVI